MPVQIQSVIAETEAKMKKTLEKLHHDFASLRTGRASTALCGPLARRVASETIATFNNWLKRIGTGVKIHATPRGFQTPHV